ncbi:MAG: CopY/TcrY family copper transport repressor [Lactobacillus sp.]|nr:copper transport repressor, CopY/TcrY family [Lentilactobacillus hilgardii ATCC 27305]MCT3392082.1 CopY/TcrY family copper transport repressor [Lentilactobacillus hilgardii]RRG12350.1 MAG: CopY/TcrY family copper transport repressor [Lactobacillus sp.]
MTTNFEHDIKGDSKMIDAKDVAISDSEWEVMRAIWTLKHVTSRQLIDVMSSARGWSESTTKTLLHRLITKDAVVRVGDGRPFEYEPAVDERDSMGAAAVNLFDHMCAMRAGDTLVKVIDSRDLSQSDIKKLQTILAEKAKTAPEMVDCNCLPQEMMSGDGCQ